MRYFVISVFVMVLVSCGESEIVHEYPDGISKPENLVESRGCGNIFVYQFLDSSKVLTTWIDANEFALTKKRQDIDLSGSTQNVSVVLEIAGDNPDSSYFNFCNDVALPNMGTTTKYQAVSGRLSFSVSEDSPKKHPIWQTFYHVTIRIENLRLVNQETSGEIIMDEIVFWNVGVGWLPG